MRRRVAILGSTGSIGTQALDVIAQHPDRFSVVALAAGRNTEKLRAQVERFAPSLAVSAADGPAALHAVATSDVDVVLAATDGAVAFDAVFAAVERGTDIAVANKELIVAAGELLAARARASGSCVVPVDSEHSAIHQCLTGERMESVARIVLTASGGPFRATPRAELESVTVEQALKHPNWAMGVKNTIDSATMMNKGLEIIEASRLFGVGPERLGVVVHPQSIVHGFVEFCDGSVKAQLCAPDMRVPIGYALSYPARLPHAPHQNDTILGALGRNRSTADLRYDFEEPDDERFPCLGLAFDVLRRGGTAPAVLSAANEVAVKAFVEGEIGFVKIATVVAETVEAVPQREATLHDIRAADGEARERARLAIEGMKTTW